MPRRPLATLALAALAACTTPQPCPKPLEECAGMCVDVQSDRGNCGACDHACGAGLSCLAGACVDDPSAPCQSRFGGAFVTLGVCGSAVKLWVERQDFIAEAEGLVGQPVAPRIPSIEVVSGADCDAQWTWHGSDLAASFVSTKPALEAGADCSVCPSSIEADVSNYLLAVKLWCPTDARVLAVDVRP
jgi:hypothetical protein